MPSPATPLAAAVVGFFGCVCSPAWAVKLVLDESEQAWDEGDQGLQTYNTSKLEVVHAIGDMRDSPSDPEVARRSCDTIARRGYEDAQKDWFLEAKGVEPIVVALENFPGVKAVQKACANAISSMALYDARNMEAAGAAGAVELLVDIMRRWPEDPEMQIGGASGCFMDYSSENRARWARAGGIEVTLASIEKHFGNREAVLQGWFAFSSGAQPPNTDRFVESGGVELALRTMREHPDSFRVREETMQAMRQVGMNSVLAKRAVEKGWLEQVVAALKHSPLDSHQQSVGCANLAIYSGRNATFRAHAAEVGAANVALEAVRTYKKMKPPTEFGKAFESQYTVLEDCVDTLAQLSLSHDGRMQMQEARVAGMLEKLFKKHSENSRLQASGKVLLQKLKSF